MDISWSLVTKIENTSIWKLSAPGGWLVSICGRYDTPPNENYNRKLTEYSKLSFIPDPNHSWEKCMSRLTGESSIMWQ